MHTSSSPQSLKNWICRDARATTGLTETKGSQCDETWRPTHRLLGSGWPALVQHWPALRTVDLEAQGEADGSDVICRVLQQTSISSRAPPAKRLHPAPAETHVNVEGKPVADGSARVNSERQLGLPVGAVIKQRPRRQLPVVQCGGNPEV